MTKLSKANRKAKSDHTDALREKYDALHAAVEKFNEALDTAWGKVEEVLGEYNEAIQEANDWRQSVEDEMQEFYDNRTEKWQESDKGQEFDQWKGEWAEEFHQVEELEKPEELAFESEDYAQMLEDMFREEME